METRVTIEHSEDSKLCIYNKPGKHLKREHLRIFSEELIAIGQDKKLNLTDHRVLSAILGLVGYDNVLDISQKELGEKIGVDQANIARTIKKLTERGYLQPIGNFGRRITYLLNPSIAFKARSKNYRTLSRCWDEKLQPDTRKMGIEPETDLDFYSKIDDRIASLAKKTGIPESKVKLLLENLLDESQKNETLEGNCIKEIELTPLPY